MVTYKVVELCIVTDEQIEDALNTWTREGWTVDSVHFAIRDGSKRPAMAFLFFVRSLETSEEKEEGEE